MVSVKEINSANRKQLKEFIEISFSASLSFPNWVPGLKLIQEQVIDPKKNPYLREVPHHYFIAEKGGRKLGRIALFGPGHWKEDAKVATIGFVVFPDDPEVYSLLFSKAESKARELGAQRMLGPLNPNIHYDVGVLARGFDAPNAVFLGYNPPYYPAVFEREGWSPVKAFQSWNLEKQNFKPAEALARMAERSGSAPQLLLRNIRLNRFEEELKLFYQLYSQCFAGHWGFTPPSFEEFKFIAGDLKHLLKAEMGMIAEWEGKAVGFVLGVPDIYHLLQKDKSGNLFPFNWLRLLVGLRKLKRMRVMIAGVLPQFQHKGIHIALFHQYTTELFNGGGIESGEIGWVLKGNSAMEKTLSRMGARPVKEYVLYEKEIGN